mgnify:CR=1 FL=1
MIKKEGPGWRLIRDRSRGDFSTLIGGENWAIELTDLEWDSFVRVVFDLNQQYLDVQNQLMGDEDITLEIERNPWFAILKGDRYVWSLKFILSQSEPFQRGAEIFWPEHVTKFLINAIYEMKDSL